MQLVIEVDDAKWAHLVAKAKAMTTEEVKVDPQELVTLKVNEYLEACCRDNEAARDAELHAAIAVLDAPAKAALLAQVKGE
jgi:hypothetical protein